MNKDKMGSIGVPITITAIAVLFWGAILAMGDLAIGTAIVEAELQDAGLQNRDNSILFDDYPVPVEAECAIMEPLLADPGRVWAETESTKQDDAESSVGTIGDQSANQTISSDHPVVVDGQPRWGNLPSLSSACGAGPLSISADLSSPNSLEAGRGSDAVSNSRNQGDSLSNLSIDDVQDVFFEGDCTLMDMQIKGVYASDGAFLVETSGARYEYVPGELKVYQGLSSNRRLLASISFDEKDAFTGVQSDSDHVLFWSKRFNIGIYGDSTLIFVPRQKVGISLVGSFLPSYRGRYKGELLLIDSAGGMQFYPQRYSAGYTLDRLDLNSANWVAQYSFEPGQRVMVAAFPGKSFNWEASRHRHIVTTYGGRGLGPSTHYGQMPSDNEISRLARYFDIINIFFQGLYKTQKPGGPYEIANETEARRLIASAHLNGIKVTFYTSLFYHFQKSKSLERYYEQIEQLKQRYDIDGVYIDGLTFDDRLGFVRIYDSFMNWQAIRKLRSLFGKDGVLIYHGTALGNQVATMPNIDAYCDVVLNGEGVKVKDVSDDYVQYQVKKYGISNVVGIWYDAHKAYPDYKERIDAILRINCRMWWGSYVPIDGPPPGNEYSWNTQPDTTFLYYLDQLKSRLNHSQN